MEHGPDILADAVAEAVSGHRCVSAWLGYGNVLFLGFGGAPIEPFTPAGRPAEPPYELHANMADWRVSGGDLAAGADDERDLAERAVSALLGRPVVAWRLGARHALSVEFAGGQLLEVVPLGDADVADSDGWSVTLPGGRVVAVSCGGQVAAIDSRRPVGEWFTGSSAPE